MFAIMLHFACPPRQSRSRNVSLLSRYGTCRSFPSERSTSALMTFPSALSDRLMLDASFSLCPSVCVALCRSDPARSTSRSADDVRFSTPVASSTRTTSAYRTNTLWLLLDSRFMAVELTRLLHSPRRYTSYVSAALPTHSSTAPSANTDALDPSLTTSGSAPSSASRSYTCSL